MAREPVLVNVVGEALESMLKALEANDEVINHLAVKGTTPEHRIGCPTPTEIVSNGTLYKFNGGL